MTSHEGKTEPPEGVVTIAGATRARIGAEEVRRQGIRDHQRRNPEPMGHFARRNVPGLGTTTGICRSRGSVFDAIGNGTGSFLGRCHRGRTPGLIPTGRNAGREGIVRKQGTRKGSMDAANQGFHVVKAALALHNPRGYFSTGDSQPVLNCPLCPLRIDGEI